jgi:hypothetical protein
MNLQQNINRFFIKLITGVIVAFVAIAVLSKYTSSPSTPNSTSTKNPVARNSSDTTETSFRRLDELLKSCSHTPIREGFEPIMMMRKAFIKSDSTLECEPASLGIARVKNGVPVWVICTGHTFNEEGVYHFNFLRSDYPKTKIWAISNVTMFQGSQEFVDRAMGTVGTPTELPVYWKGGINAQGTFCKLESKEVIEVTSSITGKKYPIIGALELVTQVDGPRQLGSYVIDYSSVKGESGTCFYGVTNDDFYTLSGSIWIDEETIRLHQLQGPPRRVAAANRWRLKE